MRPDGRREGDRWLAQAGEDLRAARRIAEIGIHYGACFFAQQAAEKAIRGALIHRGLAPPRSHSVADLGETLASLGALPEALASRAARLDLYYLPTRYPDALPGGVPARVFGEEDSHAAVSLALEVVTACQRDGGEPGGE